MLHGLISRFFLISCFSILYLYSSVIPASSVGYFRLSGEGETSWANSPDKFFNWGKRLRRNFVKIYLHFFAGAAKIAVFTTLACITIQVLLSILPLIPATILLAYNRCYCHHFSNCQLYNNVHSCPLPQSEGTRHSFIAAIARNCTTREKSRHKHVNCFCCSWHLCDSKICGYVLLPIIW